VRRQIEAAARTTAGIYKVNQEIIEGIELPLPPLAEQHRIVDALEGHLSRLDAATRELASAGNRFLPARRSHLAELRQRAVRSGATFLPLSSVASTSLGKMLDSKKNVGVETPYLRNINVRWGSFELREVATVPIPSEQRERFTVEAGDLLVCEGGEPGRCAIWPGSDTPIAYQKALHRLRPTADASAEWLALMIEEAVRNGRTARMLTGTTIKHLPQEKLRQLEIPVPSRTVQKQLADEFVSSEVYLNRLQSAASAANQRADHLRRALLDRAFTGRLVLQDPDDEPASVLLDRIRAERAAQSVKPQRKRRAPAKAGGTAGPSRTPAPEANPIPADAVQQELPL
jgi:type I restriction enzyme S subunit